VALNFARDTDVYVLYDGSYYKLHVSQIEFDQTFQQDSYRTKTIDKPTNLVDASKITSANVANFSITLPMVDESSTYQHILLQLLLSNTDNTLNTFTLFVDPSTADQPSNVRRMYQISNCVLTSGSFTIANNAIMRLQVTGQASQLTRVNHTNFNIGSYTTFDNLSYAVSKIINVTVDGTLLEGIFGVALEVQNNISWTKNKTLQNSLDIAGYTQTVYPASFTLDERVVSGSITQYVGNSLDAYTNIQTWKENIAVRVQAGLASNNYQIDAQLTPCSFTNRVTPTEIYSQAYDYRMMGHPSNLNSSFTY
tara:strand:- start:2370 stop:3296 length:927 start_codon:yes stop_codon:yes gene_type:complete